MKTNIFFITIDSLRSDRCFGANCSSKLPNMELLINKGVYFANNIVSSAQTITSLTSIFTGIYPIVPKETQSNFNKNSSTFFNFFKKNNYHTCCVVPDLYFLKNLAADFDDTTMYPYVETTSYTHLNNGVGDMIIEKLGKITRTSPWIFYVHLMDLKAPFVLHNEFDDVRYGNTTYERNLSLIDVWLGKFLDKVDLSDTVVVLSADHGKYIPITGKYVTDIPTIQQTMKKIQQILPVLTPLGTKVFRQLQKIIKDFRLKKIKSHYEKYELRSLNDEIVVGLYDEVLRTPLVIAGHGVPSSGIIKDMVRGVDIFPTIAELAHLNGAFNGINGRSLCPLINGVTMKEFPAYIQSPVYPKKLSKNIGIRTSKFKYFRNRTDPSKDVRLYDLTNDPHENKNTAQSNKEVVEEMEKILNDVYADSANMELHSFSDQEMKKIESELHKLGYI